VLLFYEGDTMKILNIQWPIVLMFTGLLYILVLLALPFNTTLATIALFAIIGYWSRLPGVGIIHPFYILYQADVIDIFMLMIAVHVSPFAAIGFLVFCNVSSRAAGIFPGWAGTAHDCIIMSVLALITPLLYVVASGNLIMVIAIYSVLRIVGFIIMGFIWPIRSIPTLLFEEAGAGVAIFLINMFYAKMFGNFFENLLQGDFGFHWPLFMIVSAFVWGFLIYRSNFSVKKVRKAVKKIPMPVREEKMKFDHDSEMAFVKNVFDD